MVDSLRNSKSSGRLILTGMAQISSWTGSLLASKWDLKAPETQETRTSLTVPPTSKHLELYLTKREKTFPRKLIYYNVSIVLRRAIEQHKINAHTKRVFDQLYIVQTHRVTPRNSFSDIHLIGWLIEWCLWEEKEFHPENIQEDEMIYEPHNLYWQHEQFCHVFLALLCNCLCQRATSILACTKKRNIRQGC